MGNVVNFTLYKTDDDPATSHDPPDRQRLEMKVYNPSPIELHALNNSNYIYTHWFYLDPELFPGNPGRTFYHIFQLKAVTDFDTYPMFTLSISQDEGFHFRLREYESTSDYFPIMPWQDLLGKWYQVLIEANYKNGVSEVPNEESGYVRVLMKDQFGRQVYPTGEESGVGYCSMFWDGMDPTTDFVRPKWGLYRNLSELHDDYDWQLFQNVQIWKKNE